MHEFCYEKFDEKPMLQKFKEHMYKELDTSNGYVCTFWIETYHYSSEKMMSLEFFIVSIMMERYYRTYDDRNVANYYYDTFAQQSLYHEIDTMN